MEQVNKLPGKGTEKPGVETTEDPAQHSVVVVESSSLSAVRYWRAAQSSEE